MVKILNLYAGIGGNRRLLPNGLEITAVEFRKDIATAYQDIFPNDTVIIGDAHEYLLKHYFEFDFIWSSPPCPTHSQYRHNVGVKGKGFDAVYPDMKLYEEIILLKHHFNGKYCVENVRSYYKPLIEPQRVSRHYVWSNFEIPPLNLKPIGIRDKNKISELEKVLGYDLSKYAIKGKRQVLRNCVNSKMGLHIFNAAKIT